MTRHKRSRKSVSVVDPPYARFDAGGPNGSFPYIHTTSDTLATMGESAQNSVKFAQFALAYLGETAKTRGRVTGGPAQVLPAQ